MTQGENRIDLSGTWKCRLDPDDRGLAEQWYDGALAGADVRLPGTAGGNRLGEPLAMEPELTREGVRSLRQRYRYVGAAWYQREVRIPAEWDRKAVELFLERVMFQSRVWVDGREVGERDSLSTPHRYDLSRYVKPGSAQRLTIRIDNRDVRHIGPYPSAYTDETQTIWNGMIGRLELKAEDFVRCADIQVYPDLPGRKVTVKVRLANDTGRAERARFILRAQCGNAETAQVHAVPPAVHERVVPAGGGTEMFEYELGRDARLWDEFEPNLYRLRVSLRTEGEIAFADEKDVVFGMREFKADGTRFAINGRPTFLRGTLECCVFPLTGHPPTDADSWMRIMRTVKSYGLNHIRFHSWCPPEAAFAAADALGVYVQAEGPMWMDAWNGYPVGSRPDHYDYLPAEARRISETYGNHPSFCLFSNGNELRGDFGLLHSMAENLKREDGRRVYTLTSNWDRKLDPADDYFVAQTVDGVGARGQYFPNELAQGTMLDFTEAVSRRNVPVVSHEIGQYTVYPNVDEIPKYDGALRPINLEAIRDDLRRKGMLGDAAKFTFNSGMLALQLYRDEIEAALRTPGLGGFQMLDLHDFPGQSTATVGLLDAFWDSKGLTVPEAFRRFCGSTVLLLRMPKRIYTAGERFEAQAEIAHYGPEDLRGDRLRWTIADPQGRVVGSGACPAEHVPTGCVTPLGAVSAGLEGAAAPARLTVSLSLEREGACNSWEIWVYPAADRAEDQEAPASGGVPVAIAEAWSEETERLLDEGHSVLLLAAESGLRAGRPGKFFPVFWSPVHFASEDPCGIVVDDGHPAFARFPVRSYADYPWKDLLDRSASLCLDGLPPGFRPIVQVIPNFYHNQRLGNLLEARVGNGKLLVCSIDLSRGLKERPAARQLRRSLLAYMASDRFAPAERLTFAQVRSLFAPASDRRDAAPSAESAPAVSDPADLALGRRAFADSEASPEFAASKGNDGDELTLWRAADGAAGHWWAVDLGAERDIRGTRITFAEEARYQYAIQVSRDGVHWQVAVNRTGQTEAAKCREDAFSARARYVKLVYNGLPPGVRAGHSRFEVYGA
jgi:hypothetical protein